MSSNSNSNSHSNEGIIELDSDALDAINSIVKMSIDYMQKHLDRDEQIVKFKTPKELEEIIHFTISEQGTGLKGILGELKSVMEYSVRTGHIRFFNQLWAGCDVPAVMGEWLTAVMNGSMYTYEVSPVFSIMEVRILEKVRKLIGWTGGDGVFAPGGANCNMLAILAARNAASSTVRQHGIGSEKFVCFSSELDHYTIQRSAGVIGIGEDNCIKVATDSKGRIIPDALEKAILKAKSEGKTPFFINATAGTTVFGAFDPLHEIAAIAKKYSVWAHLDACWGGYTLLSKKYRHLIDGCEKYDSVAWTATKCLGIPQQCAALLTKERGILLKCNAMNKDYLFHQHDEMEWDLGDKTLNCGRRVDAFKLWVAWKVVGDQGLEDRVNHAFAQAQHLTKQLLAQKEKFKMVLEQPESLNVCFWFIPPSVRGLPDGDPKKAEAMGNATALLRKRIQKEGKILFNYSDMHGLPGHFFRMITCNPHAITSDMDFILSELERLGSDL